jgi:hypothetical protein
VGQSPRWGKIFVMTAGCPIQAMILIGPAQDGQTSRSTSRTCLISCTQARFAAAAGT